MLRDYEPVFKDAAMPTQSYPDAMASLIGAIKSKSYDAPVVIAKSLEQLTRLSQWGSFKATTSLTHLYLERPSSSLYNKIQPNNEKALRILLEYTIRHGDGEKDSMPQAYITQMIPQVAAVSQRPVADIAKLVIKVTEQLAVENRDAIETRFRIARLTNAIIKNAKQMMEPVHAYSQDLPARQFTI